MQIINIRDDIFACGFISLFYLMYVIKNTINDDDRSSAGTPANRRAWKIYIQFMNEHQKLQFIPKNPGWEIHTETEQHSKSARLIVAQPTSGELFAMTLKPTPFFDAWTGISINWGVPAPVSAESAGSVWLDTLTRFENIQVVARVCDLPAVNFVMNLKVCPLRYPIK